MGTEFQYILKWYILLCTFYHNNKKKRLPFIEREDCVFYCSPLIVQGPVFLAHSRPAIIACRADEWARPRYLAR